MTTSLGHDRSPVFVLSHARSGSTLLRYMLDSHPDVASPGEVVLGQLCSWLVRALPRLRLGADLNVEDIGPELLRETRDYIGLMMDPYLKRKGKKIWCDKSPANLEHLPLLAKIFPEARFICLYRSCLDVVDSCLEESRGGYMMELQEYIVRYPGSFVQGMMESWIDRSTRLIVFETDHHQISHRIRYEDLVRNPKPTLMQLCRFLKLEWHEEMATKALQIEHDTGGGDQKIRAEREIHQRSIGTGSRLPLDSLPVPLVGRANQVLKSLGYQAIRRG